MSNELEYDLKILLEEIRTERAIKRAEHSEGAEKITAKTNTWLKVLFGGFVALQFFQSLPAILEVLNK